MTTLPSAAALAVLVILSGIAGVVAADPTDASPTAGAPTAVETDGELPVGATGADAPTDAPPGDAAFERRLAERLGQFDLTDGQVRTIVSEAVRLREAGASRLVVRSSVVVNLHEFGVDAPFLYADGGDDATAGERFAERLGERFDLTDAQIDEIAATVDRMHAAGAARAEIYRAVRTLLVEYGVGEDEVDALDRRVTHARVHQLNELALRHHHRAHDLHERAHRLHHAAAHDADRARDGGVASHDVVDRRVDALADQYDLTDEQAATLERLVRGMLADGAARDEVYRAVRDQLADWGVDRSTADPGRERTPVGDRSTAR